MNLNTRSISRLAGILSNSVLLAANTYLIASNLKSNLAEKKRSQVMENLQLTSEVASAIAGLSKVVTDNLERYHADREDL
jgi:hypothetical protein